VLLTLGEGLGRFSAARARDSSRSLMALQPQTATLLERHAGTEHGDHGADGDEEAHDQAASHEHRVVVPAAELVPGDVILVRPGERLPADGAVIRGESSVDQAAVSGESTPLARGVGDPVLAGTVNLEGVLEVEVMRSVTDSTVARIARLVEQAQAQRSPAEAFVDRFARWYTPAVVALAIVVVGVPVVFSSRRRHTRS